MTGKGHEELSEELEMLYTFIWLAVTCMYTYIRAGKLYIENIFILLCVSYTLSFLMKIGLDSL